VTRSSKGKSAPRLNLALVGSSGRMGHKIKELLSSPDDPIASVFNLVWHGSARDPRDLASLTKSKADVIIDFSKPEATLSWVRAYTKTGTPPATLICTTGFNFTELGVLKKSLKNCSWSLVPNTSLGVFAMSESLKLLARTLPADYAFSIHESHHAKKVDAPSGTGLFLQSLIEKERPNGSTVAISSVRGGSDPGTHTVTILGPYEKITMTHSAEDRRLFARGALTLGLALVKQKSKNQIPLEKLVLS
jgi:4-hydroxy-tetrahydrodipicolinate reductase